MGLRLNGNRIEQQRQQVYGDAEYREYVRIATVTALWLMVTHPGVCWNSDHTLQVNYRALPASVWG